jgi:F0F1-type ATP synthase membrane subunit b/b'
MPQLDKVTFLSQFFWLAFFYIGFYFIVLKHFLPKMTRIMKLRKRKMAFSQTGANSLFQENEKVRSTFDTLIAKGVSKSRTLIFHNFQQTENWLQNIQQKTNQTHYQNLNKSYIFSLGESSFKENLALSQALFSLPEKFYTELVFSKI